MMTQGQVHYTVQEHIAALTLDRPEKLNALHPDMLAQLDDYAERIEKDVTIRVVVLAAAGERAFCVGADILAWSALAPLDMRHWIRDGHRVFNRIASLPQPVIAALNGLAYGGGLELALTADLRIAVETARFAMPEVKLATIPGWGGTQRLPQLIGTARALQMILTGEPVDAATAERWGLVNEVVPADHLMERAYSLADMIARNAPVAVQTAKQLVRSQADLDSMVAVEALAGAMAAMTEDAQEGARAFREKREPHFTGR